MRYQASPEDEEAYTPSPTTSSPSHSPAPANLATMPVPARESLYRAHFAHHPTPLSAISTPPQCETYPSFADEITGAYLFLTTFTVPVWVNYDAASTRFYDDAKRVRDCGVLKFSKKEKRGMKAFQVTRRSFQSIRFDVGTPFRVLAHLYVVVVDTETGVINASVEAAAELPFACNNLRDWLDSVCKELNARTLDEGQEGLEFGDVGEIAGMVVRRADRTGGFYDGGRGGLGWYKGDGGSRYGEVNRGYAGKLARAEPSGWQKELKEEEEEVWE